MAYGIVLLPSFRQPSVSCNILQLFDHFCHYSPLPFTVNTPWHQVSLLLYHLLVVTNLLFPLCSHAFLLLVYTYHSCKLSHVLLLFPISHFTSLQVLAFCPVCLLTLCLLHTFPCSHLIAIVHLCLRCFITVFFYTCVLFVRCTLLASCMLVQPCTLIVPCTLIAYVHSMCPCDPFHTGHFILTSHFCFLVAVRALPTLRTLPFAHGPPCSMHLLTICNTILVWGILVAHLTPLAHRCSLHYVQSQFSLTHHFIPNYLLFPSTHSLLYMPFFNYVHLPLCSHFLFCVHFYPYAHSLPHLCSSPHSCSLLLLSD